MDHSDIVESIARGMIDRFGSGAAHVARAFAEVSDEVHDQTVTSSETWCEIVDAIERLLVKP
jgi:hypothetical protein